MSFTPPNDEIQLILISVQAGEHTRGGRCGSIGFNAEKEDNRKSLSINQH